MLCSKSGVLSESCAMSEEVAASRHSPCNSRATAKFLRMRGFPRRLARCSGGVESNADSGVQTSSVSRIWPKNKQRSDRKRPVSGGFVVSGGSIVNFSGCNGCTGSTEFPDPATVAGRSECDMGDFVPEVRFRLRGLSKWCWYAIPDPLTVVVVD